MGLFDFNAAAGAGCGVSALCECAAYEGGHPVSGGSPATRWAVVPDRPPLAVAVSGRIFTVRLQRSWKLSRPSKPVSYCDCQLAVSTQWEPEVLVTSFFCVDD